MHVPRVNLVGHDSESPESPMVFFGPEEAYEPTNFTMSNLACFSVNHRLRAVIYLEG